MINKNIIEEALSFYNINNVYKDKCFRTLAIINKQEKFSESYEKVYKILFEEEIINLEKLWTIEDINELFTNSIEPFITNIMILSGYKVHKNNIENYQLNNNQINIHKRRVKECFESDLINRGYKGARISQMLWATYFIRMRIVEVGSLQFEYENDSIIKIHIPKNSDLSIIKVKESIENSKIELEKIYNIDNYKYTCNSWLLSNQLYSIIDKNTNISQFHDLFKIADGENCLKDILNFAFNIQKCDNYSSLEERTSLQRKIKKELLNGNKFYLGNGILK